MIIKIFIDYHVPIGNLLKILERMKKILSKILVINNNFMDYISKNLVHYQKKFKIGISWKTKMKRIN